MLHRKSIIISIISSIRRMESKSSIASALTDMLAP